MIDPTSTRRLQDTLETESDLAPRPATAARLGHDNTPANTPATGATDRFEGAARSAIVARRQDESLRMFAANRGAAPAAGPSNRRDDVLYVGMNTANVGAGGRQCDAEAKALAAMTNRHATRIERPTTPLVEHVGQRFDTATDAGCKAFAQSLGLDPPRTEAVARALTGNDVGRGRTELAEIAKTWSTAETGAVLPGRLVLSGHCGGVGVYDGDETGDMLRYESLQALARAMPKASGQIEDVMLSACYSGDEGSTTAWRDAFPNMKSLWAYGGVPDAHSPTGVTAVEHIRVWEQATRADHAPLTKGEAAAGTTDAATAARIHALPMHDHVSVWTVTGGYHNAM